MAISMQLTEENYWTSHSVVKDILYMYVDMIESYDGFGHNIAVGEFDPTDWYQLEIYEPEGINFAIDATLIQTGSAISLLLSISDAWDEYDTWKVQSNRIIWAKEASDNKLFSHLPLIEKAFNAGFSDTPDDFYEIISQVYEEYVCGYFKNLLGSRCK